MFTILQLIILRDKPLLNTIKFFNTQGSILVIVVYHLIKFIISLLNQISHNVFNPLKYGQTFTDIMFGQVCLVALVYCFVNS